MDDLVRLAAFLIKDEQHAAVIARDAIESQRDGDEPDWWVDVIARCGAINRRRLAGP